ncbi:MAG: hypothetical protein ACFFDT_25160 [Candidatus Hodarchaeota archaeon]
MILIVMKNQWEGLAAYQPFLKSIQEKRDSYSLRILSEAISPLEDVVNRFFPLEEPLNTGEPPKEVLSDLEESLRKYMDEEDKIE